MKKFLGMLLLGWARCRSGQSIGGMGGKHEHRVDWHPVAICSDDDARVAVDFGCAGGQHQSGDRSRPQTVGETFTILPEPQAADADPGATKVVVNKISRGKKRMYGPTLRMDVTVSTGNNPETNRDAREFRSHWEPITHTAAPSTRRHCMR